MARPGISYEQVAAAADALEATGQRATIASVRQKLGTGSPNTVHEHLKAWRAQRPAAPVTAFVLPPALAAAFSLELQKTADQTKATMEEDLAQARGEIDALAMDYEKLEEEKATLAELVATLTTERDKLAAQMEIQGQEIIQQQEQIERETKALQQAHVDMAKLQIKDDMYAEKAAEQTKEVERLRELLSAAQSSSAEAVRYAAVLEAQLKASEERAQRAEASTNSALQEQAKTVNAANENMTKLQTELDKRLQAERVQTQEAMASGNTAREQAARLAGQLEMLEKQLQQMREAAVVPKPAA